MKLHKIASIKTFGQSMMPLLLDGDIVYFKKIPFSKIQVNDIVVFKRARKLVTHRVIYKTKKFLITKGDKDFQADGKRYPKQIVGIVYQIKRDGEAINLENFYLLQSSLYFQEIITIKNQLEKQKIDFVFLKGLPLHLYFEKTHPARVYLDCDVLVKKNAFSKAEKILVNRGYKKVSSALSKTQKRLKDKEIEVSYYKIINGLPVVFDLHLEAVFMMIQLGRLEALYPQKFIDELTEEFLKTKTEIKIQGHKLFILNSELLILYLALHFFHHNFRGVFRLEFLAKIIASYRSNSNRFGSNWPGLASKIKLFRLENFVYPVFILLKKLYKTPVPKSFLKSIQPSSFYLQYLSSILHHPSSIFNDEPRFQAGVNRFKNLFFLSPQPLWKKILVFFNPQVIYFVLWLFKKRLSSFF